MDLLTHIVITRTLIGRSARIVTAGVLADAPFSLTEPAWPMSMRERRRAVATND
jgi:hypothetical protein